MIEQETFKNQLLSFLRSNARLVRNTFRVVGAFALLFALISLGFALFSFQRTEKFLREASRADGTVTRLLERRDHDSGSYFYPVYSWKDPAGQEHELYSTAGSFPPAYSVGDAVTILYHPDHPRDAQLDTFFSLWGLPSILAGVGIFDLFVGAAFLFTLVLFDRLQRGKPMNQNAITPPGV